MTHPAAALVTGRAVVVRALAVGCVLPLAVAAAAAEPSAAARDAVIGSALAAGDRSWAAVADAEPAPDFSCRWPVGYTLALCEARAHADRVPRLLDLAARMQDRDPRSRWYGNFRWYWRDAAVTDANAVEFCALDLHLVWRLHRDWLPEPARQTLEDLCRHAVEGCLRHRVRPTYTNIAILNAANLITLGEALELPAAAAEGYRRLESMAVETWRHGLHEYSSPVYYAIDLVGLQAIERFAAQEPGREQARLLLELIWTDVAANWFPPAARLAGPSSRSYDYLLASGGIGDFLRWEGWIDAPPRGGLQQIHVIEGRWRPPARLHELARTRFPRLVRQSWGPLAEQSRTHLLLADVTLGCAGAGYGPDDSPLTFDLPGPPGTPRGTFIPDGREDPYGRVRYATGHAGHRKPLHLRPFWAGAQRGGDAVGLAVYRDDDLAGPEMRNLQSHVVMPRGVDGLWLRGERRAIDDLAGTAAAPVCIPVSAGDPLVLRQGSAAVGLRVVWARAQDGGPAGVALVGDGNRWGALRLTVDHRRDEPTALAGVAVWVRIGGGLDDDAFAAWREAWERADPAEVAVTPDRVGVGVAGVDGRVAVVAEAPFTESSAVLLEPPPTRAVLELDGEDVGRALFAAAEPFRSYAAAVADSRAVRVPDHGGVAWEAEAGLVLPRMACVKDGDASGGRFVAAEAAAGSVNWKLDVARGGPRWLWARVRAADPASDSFWLVATDGRGRRIARGAWHLPRSADWTWTPLRLERAAAPTPLDLPAGTVEVALEPREPGSAVDALWLTSDPDARPPDVTPPGSGPR